MSAILEAAEWAYIEEPEFRAKVDAAIDALANIAAVVGNRPLTNEERNIARLAAGAALVVNSRGV